MSTAEVRFKELTADFGKTANDYGRHRAGFPDEFFERLKALGILRAGMRALDLGTGTGTIARGLATGIRHVQNSAKEAHVILLTPQGDKLLKDLVTLVL